ncbi:hypothetical protein [Herbiconiux sp. 11R-BC]|uniref:hypothetical protein n=1 Tax=Herbiconiux sp. 11R-BC TaxID=3111637 RepID=UPI003C2CC6EF
MTVSEGGGARRAGSAGEGGGASDARRWRFRGRIAGFGSTSGVRVVVGMWEESPLGAFADVMVEDARGHRILLAPSEEVAAFVSATYAFDEVRVGTVGHRRVAGGLAVWAGPARPPALAGSGSTADAAIEGPETVVAAAGSGFASGAGVAAVGSGVGSGRGVAAVGSGFGSGRVVAAVGSGVASGASASAGARATAATATASAGARATAATATASAAAGAGAGATAADSGFALSMAASDAAPQGETADWLRVRIRVGRLSGLGRMLRAVPRGLATSPAWATAIDPIARVVGPGLRTAGSAGAGRREYYGATAARRIVWAAGCFDGGELGGFAPLDPPVRFGFGSAPADPQLVDVVTTIVERRPR